MQRPFSNYPFSKFILILLLGIASLPVQAQMGQPTEIKDARIDSVRLYLSGAEVFRSEELVLKPGRNHFVFTGLSSKLYPKSIRVAADVPSVKIRSVTSKTDFLTKREQDQRIRHLQDSTKMVREAIEDLNDEIGAYKEERNLLNANESFKGEDKTLSVEELEKLAEFYRRRHQAINKAMTKRNREIAELNRRLFDLKLMLKELNADQIPLAEAHLVVDSDRATKTKIDFRYVVADAGWVALYDLEAADLSDPITLRYRANAYNNTGVDWDKINITLTTIDPLQSATQPRLDVWDITNFSASSVDQQQVFNVNNITIVNDLNPNYQSVDNFYNQNKRSLYDLKQRQQSQFQSILGKDWKEGIDYETDLYRAITNEELARGESSSGLVNVTFPDFNTDFPIDGTFSLPSDKKPYSLEIDAFKLDVTYKYYAVPRMDKDAFLIAQIVGWEDLNLVSGPVNIYNGAEYIGQSSLDIRNISDTLSVSLGRDKDVVVTRLKVKGKTRKQLLGTTMRESNAFNISVANHKGNAIDIQVMDQVPISNNKDVVIMIDELTEGKLVAATGMVTWDMRLESGATRTMDFGYTVKYPKGTKANLQFAPARKLRSLDVEKSMY